MEDPFAKILQEFQKILNKGPGQAFKGWKLVVAVAVIGFIAFKGFYIVAPDEQGIVLRFGQLVRTSGPGPHLLIPLVEEVLLPKITKLHRIEVGFRTSRGGVSQMIPQEALMVTGDENIVAVELIVQFRIKDAEAFLFNVADIGPTIKKSTEAAIRQVIGQTNIDEALTVGKARIQQEAMEGLQAILDDYGAGVQITAIQLQDVDPPEAVASAFKDVASAKEDKEKLINEAHGYRNDIIPKAKGEAAQVINEAQAYAEARVRRAEGDADRFLKTLKEYQQAKNIIRKRIYIETMETVMGNIEKVIIDKGVAGKTLPFLPIGREGLSAAAGRGSR
ncbi:FtsH protease activity modulator HflK [Nitrospira defluvii]|nr:FtsH protease activity modulator HflK [Nitrospira defluvii]